MRFIHTSDWHLGRSLGEWSLLEEQRAFLASLRAVLRESRADALVVAGDIFDRSVAPAEAVGLLDEFLCTIKNEEKIPVIMVAGNHDSPERLSFASEFLREGGVYIRGVQQARLEKVTLEDEHGKVDFWLLPWPEPADIRRLMPGASIHGFSEAVAALLKENPPEPGRRSVLVSHGFFANVEHAGELLRSDSEISVGTGELIDSSLCSNYDYVALGHLHRAQKAGAENIRYSGSPLKYSLSEARGEKSVTLVELGAGRGALSTKIPVAPLRDLRLLRGSMAELLAGEGSEDYIYVQLMDEAPLEDSAARLRAVFPRLAGVRLLAREGEASAQLANAAGISKKSIEELFSEFYSMLKESPLEGERLRLLREAIDVAQRGERER